MLSLWRQKCVCSTSCLREKARKLEAEVSRAFGVPTGRVWDEIGLFFQISGANTCESEVVGAVEMEGGFYALPSLGFTQTSLPLRNQSCFGDGRSLLCLLTSCSPC